MPDESPPSLFGELQRRRVFRVTAVYVVAAWVAIQAAATIFPNIGLPSWSVTLVIALAGLALPVVVALAWIYDVTPEGVRRTGAARLRTPLAPAASHGRARTIAYLAIALLALPGGWLLLRAARGSADDLDPHGVVILPFRVSGADAPLAYLREGVPDLLVATLGTDTARSAVPMRAVLAALDRAGGRQQDLLTDEAAALARELGAGQVLVGELVQSGPDLTITAALHDSRDGSRRADLRATAPRDSLHLLIDRMTNQLIAALGGTPQHRLASLTSTSRAAIDEFVRGSAAYRHGRFQEAAAHFDRAVDFDSTFALAAFMLARSAGWWGRDPPNTPRARRLTARNKHQLGVEDRLFFEAWVGPRYPDELSPYAELIAHRERTARLYPQHAELLYTAGDGLFHFGRLVGREDFLEASADYFERALRIDTTYLEPLVHLVDIALLHDDTASLRRYVRLFLAVDSASPNSLLIEWIARLRLGERQRNSAQELIETHGLEAADGLLFKTFVEPAGLVEVMDAAESTAAGFHGEERREALGIASFFAMVEGRPETLEQLLTRPENVADPPSNRLQRALWWQQDSAAAERAAEALEATPQQATAATCMLALWYARSGRPERARARLSAFAPDSGLTAGETGRRELCRQLIGTAIAHATHADTALAALVTLDGMLRSGIRVSELLNYANIEAARMWEEAGHPDRALAAQRRQFGYGEAGPITIERLADEGRLAELTGDRDGAIRAYQTYLRYRTRPEGAFIERTEQIRERLTALTAEPRQ